MTTPDAKPHPLFPQDADDDDDTPEVGWIHVTRFEGHKGQVFAPTLYAADQLTGEDQILACYGGGAYELIARNVDKSRISARRRLTLPGTPLPLAPESSPPPSFAASPSPSAAPPGEGLLGLILTMMMKSMEMQMSQSQQQTQLFITMMSGQMQAAKSDTNSFVQMMANLAQSDKATMASFFTEMQKTKTSGQSNGVSALKEGMELGLDLAKMSGGDGAQGSGDLMALVEGFKAYMNSPAALVAAQANASGAASAPPAAAARAPSTPPPTAIPRQPPPGAPNGRPNP